MALSSTTKMLPAGPSIAFSPRGGALAPAWPMIPRRCGPVKENRPGVGCPRPLRLLPSLSRRSLPLEGPNVHGGAELALERRPPLVEGQASGVGALVDGRA